MQEKVSAAFSGVCDDEVISVIIPCYNEQNCIEYSIESIVFEDNVEVIISDGGSTDKTLDIVESLSTKYVKKIRVIHGGESRAECQNSGVKFSTGSIVLFLHADTVLRRGWSRLVRDVIRDKRITKKPFIGCFQFSLSKPLKYSLIRYITYRIIEVGTNLRVRLLSLPYGDQALFLEKRVFEALGGFPSIPFMEDYELICLAKKMMEIVVVDMSVVTSNRRWENFGIVWNTLHNQIILVGRAAGVPHDRLVQW